MEEALPPMARPRVAAGALFTNDAGEVLLVKPSYKEGWDIPGGYVEPGETPVEACGREIFEELGWRVRVSKLLVADWAPSSAEGDKVLFVFDGGRPKEEDLERIQLQQSELAGWAFRHPTEFPDLMPDRLARRLLAATLAAAAGRTSYLEFGDLL